MFWLWQKRCFYYLNYKNLPVHQKILCIAKCATFIATQIGKLGDMCEIFGTWHVPTRDNQCSASFLNDFLDKPKTLLRNALTGDIDNVLTHSWSPGASCGCRERCRGRTLSFAVGPCWRAGKSRAGQWPNLATDPVSRRRHALLAGINEQEWSRCSMLSRLAPARICGHPAPSDERSCITW